MAQSQGSENGKLLTVILESDGEVDRLGHTYRTIASTLLRYERDFELRTVSIPLTATGILGILNDCATKYIVFVKENHILSGAYLRELIEYLRTRTVYMAEPVIFDTKIPANGTEPRTTPAFQFVKNTDIYGIAFHVRRLRELLEAAPGISRNTVYINYRLYWSIQKIAQLKTAYSYGSQTYVTNGVQIDPKATLLFVPAFNAGIELRLGMLRFMILFLRGLHHEDTSPVAISHLREIVQSYDLRALVRYLDLRDRIELAALNWLADSNQRETRFKIFKGHESVIKVSTEVPDDGDIALYRTEFSDHVLYTSKAYKPFDHDEVFSSPALYDHYSRPVTAESTILIFDRSNKADDNAEHFYRYMRTEHSEFTKIHFALAKSSPDWKRLAEEGFNLVEMFSKEFYALFLESDVVVSSQMYNIRYLGKNFSNSRFIYLQHGVQLNDMTDWVVSKHFDVFVCTGRPELEYMQRIAPVESINSGLPRFAALPSSSLLASPFAESEARDILFMPTWRFALNSVTDEAFVQSEYFKSIDGLLSSPELNEYLEVSGRRLLVKLHPNLIPRGKLFRFNDRIINFDGSYGELIRAGAVVVTDYTSAIVDGAFMGMPVVYFQWDEDDFFDEQPYEARVNYRTHGMGPVITNLHDVIDYLVEERFVSENPKYDSRREWFFEGVPRDAINDTIFKKMLEI